MLALYFQKHGGNGFMYITLPNIIVLFGRGNTIENNNLKTNNMIQKEMAAKLHASEIRVDIDYPQMSSKIWSHVKSEQERAFLAGFDYSNRWYLVENLPKNYNCQILVKKEN